MPGWKNSNRKYELPRDWHRIRRRIEARANGICEHPGCARRGNQCDHIRPGNDHSDDNLQWLCEPHHRAKSSAEGGRAPRRKRKRGTAESHPGIIS